MISTASPFQPGPSARALAILVVDESDETLQMLRSWLEEAGHAVSCASCGNDAVRQIKEHLVNVVITEVIMPNGDGLEVILELKKRQPSARVIAVSAGGRYLPAADCLRVAKGLGAHDALPKPMNRQAVLEAVDRIAAEMPVAVA